MKKKRLSADKYPPRCAYCKKGRLSPDGESVLCEKNGIVEKKSSCRSYKYDVSGCFLPFFAPELAANSVLFS